MLSYIENIIEKAYEVRGARMVCTHDMVSVTGENVRIRLNSEDPYIGAEFFSLVDEVIDKMGEKGYSKTSSNFYSDFYIANFTKTK